MKLQQTTDPGAALVSTADAKAWLRVESVVTEDDTLIDALVSAATTHVESMTNRALIERTYTLYLDDFCDRMQLPRGNVSAVASVQYLDTSEALQTLAATVYELDSVNDWRAAVVLADGQSWPSIGDGVNPVRINYTAGYGAAATDVPDPIVTAVKGIMTDMYEHRGENVTAQYSTPDWVQSMLAQYRIEA